MRFIATASVTCASVEIEPSDIAPVAKRLTISTAGSTSSIGIAFGRIDLELEQSAQRHQALALVVDERRVLLVGREAVAACRVLQLGDRVGRPHVRFAARAVGVLAAGIEHRVERRVVAERAAMQADRFFGDLEDVDAFDLRRRAREVLIDERLREPDRLRRSAHRNTTCRSRCPSST